MCVPHPPNTHRPLPSLFKGEDQRRGGVARMGVPQINGYLKLKHMARTYTARVNYHTCARKGVRETQGAQRSERGKDIPRD